jgi:hypothetical protein
MAADMAAHRLATAMGSNASLMDRTVETPPPELLETGAYLTDGIDLFCVVSLTAPSRDPRIVELEDCRTLETRIQSAVALVSAGFRQVRADGPEKAGE